MKSGNQLVSIKSMTYLDMEPTFSPSVIPATSSTKMQPPSKPINILTIKTKNDVNDIMPGMVPPPTPRLQSGGRISTYGLWNE